MRDIHFAAFMVLLFMSTAAAYLVRAALHGRVRHPRSDADGGSVIVGKPVMEMGYWLFQPVIGLLRRLGVTPDMVTGFSLVPGVGAGVAAASGWLGLACFLATLSALCDLVDGLLARELRVGSDAGELFDASVDRYTESLLMGGLAIHFRDDLPMLIVTLVGFFGGFMVSYVSAKAEALTVPAPRGLMRRAERAIYVIAGCGFSGLSVEWLASSPNRRFREWPICLALIFLAVVANLSVVQRLRAVRRALEARGHTVAAAPPVEVGGTHHPARPA